MKYTTPAELGHHLVFLSLVDANYSDEFGTTTATAFADAWEAIQFFIEHTPDFDAKLNCGSVFTISIKPTSNSSKTTQRLRRKW